MRRLLAALACTLGLPGPLAALCTGESLAGMIAPADQAEIAANVAATPYPEGLFWRATRGGQELRLIGTMHLHDPRHEALMPRIEAAFEGADLVMLELTRAEEAEVQQAMLTEPDRMFLTEGPTLPELLDEATWDALAEAARERQVPAFMAAKFQPWYLSLTLAMPACAMPDLLSGKRGLDHRIMDLAEERGLPTQALEPWDTLFKLMEEGTMDEQLDMLRLSLVPEDLQSAMMVAMLDGYFEEAVAEVWETSRVGARLVPGMDPEEAEAQFVEIQDALLDTRNRNWVPVIEEAAAQNDTVVIAVGAAHLPGEAGLLRLLEAEGWEIARIR